MTTFQKLPIGAKFKLAGDNEVLIKVRDEGYESADNRLIHGDADPDYPVIRIEDCYVWYAKLKRTGEVIADCMESYPAAERAANNWCELNNEQGFVVDFRLTHQPCD